ncbi:MAG: 4-hydroxy-tetrahydrodipicolinate synthase [Clostridia bacterium]|nr:4-hydroxy-tetrahydrodipicolinate synthase [Clostridia bacterium]
MSFIFKGAGVALVTPFVSGGVNFELMGELIDRQIDAGIDAILPLGTTGEPCTMTVAERHDVAEYCVKRVSSRVPVITGCGGNDTRECVEMAERMQDCGSDALLVVTPYYNRATQQGLIAHYTAIADAVSIPIMMYNVPSRTGVNMTSETAATLSLHPRIRAYKQASESIEQLARDARLLKDAFVFAGNDHMALAALAVGAMGVVSVAANIDPISVVALTRAFFAGDMALARDMQTRVATLSEALFCEVSPIPCKAALEIMGYTVGHPRLPLTPASDEARRRLTNALSALGINR